MTRLMIVDDDADIRFLLATALRHAGYDVRTAADGFEALHLMSLQAPDVLLTDVGMPRLDGWRLLQVCRSQALLAKVPVIVMSAIDELADQAGARGADGFLVKPFTWQDARRAIEGVVARRASDS
jgi:twitching motility two-component system response regulator PilG